MRKSLLSVSLWLALALPVHAQEIRGNISGTVKDATGAVIPGASVKITSTDTAASQQLVTNETGYFEAPLMQPGNYEISVELPGFKRITQRGVVLGVAQQMTISFTLEVGKATDEVTVTADAPLLDTTAVSSAQTLDKHLIEGLPMISNMPIMLTRYSAGVNPSTNQSLVSQGFADGTTTAAGGAIGGVGSNNYSIDGATNNGTGRRIAASPNADMIEEMRVESSNFDASIGHGLGLQISMMTRAGANQYHGSVNYQYWTNKFNELNPSQRLTFSPKAKALYDTGRSHNLAFTLGGPVAWPFGDHSKQGPHKLFFFGNYSYVNDFIPGKNQISSTIPASAAELNGDFSDLLKLPNPAQYQIYDPLTVRPDPANSNRFIRDPFPNNVIPSNRIVNPLFKLYKQMLPKPNQNLIENGATPTANYYRGGEPDKPASSLFAGRVDYNISNSNRLFIRGSGNTFLEGVNDWTYEVPEFEGLHSLDRTRYNWGFVGNWTHTTGTTVIDTQLASNRFFQDDLFKRLHEYKPTNMGLPGYLDEFCQAQKDCMLPVVTIGGNGGVNYQGISSAASSGDTATNIQATVNLTKIKSGHTLRGGVDARMAQRKRGPGGTPSGQLTFTNDFTRQASDTAQLTPSNLGLTMAAFMLGIPTTSVATIQPTTNLRNHFWAGYAQDTWRLTGNLTLNFGLRVEREDGISEDKQGMIVDFDPNAKLAISDLAEAAYARAAIPQLSASDFHVRGGSVYASAAGRDGTTWRPEVLWMPRVSASYKLGDKTVLKAGYGMYFDTLNAADYTANITGFSSTTTNTNSTDFGRTFQLGNPYAGVLGISDPFPLRADGARFDQPTGASLGVDTSAGLAANLTTFNHKHARQQRWRAAIQREVAGNLSVEVAYDASFSDRLAIDIRQDYLPQQYWIPGSLNARDSATQTLLTANVTNPYAISNFAPLRTSNPVLYQRMATNGFFTAPTTQRNRLLRPFSQINNLTFNDLPIGKARAHSLLINVSRRFSGGFSANAALSFNNSRRNRTVEEYDRAPTLWWDDNNSRPYRLTAAAVYELPLGRGKPMLNNGGVLAALVGGWQAAGTFERQPGSMINFNTNLFYNGDIKDIKKTQPEIALHSDGTLDATKYWFNVDKFEKDPAKTPTSFQTRAFPFQIDGLRGPGLMYLNLNVTRKFSLGEQRVLQARFDVQNVLNYAAFGNPNVDPTNTNFGKVTTAVAAAGAMRFFSFGMRFGF